MELAFYQQKAQTGGMEAAVMAAMVHRAGQPVQMAGNCAHTPLERPVIAGAGKLVTVVDQGITGEEKWGISGVGLAVVMHTL